MKRGFTIAMLLLAALSVALPQQGITAKIVGRVLDAETGEALIGANVTIESSRRGAATDIDGRFTIQIEPGTYTVIVSSVSYARKRIPNVVCTPTKEASLYIVLTSDAVRIDEVVIEARRNTSFEGALLTTQKNGAVIKDGISAEQIKRSPDATSGDALRRLTGISLVDNKFVFVRGVTDRYNQTTLNGTAVTSTDADKKSFSFDILPANLLENTVVIKTATPDMRGDFTGGLVQISTLDFSDQAVFKVTYSSAANSMTTGKTLLGSQGGAMDWLGIDDGTRALPSDVQGAALAQALPNNWAPRNRTAPLNQSFSLSYGNTFRFGDGTIQSDELGFIAALTYRNSFQRNDRVINDVALGRYNVGTRDDYSVLWGGLANLSYKFNAAHKVSFKNNYNRSAEDQIGRFVSQDRNTSLENHYTLSNWNQRLMYSSQLSGDHHFPGMGSVTLEWRASYSQARRDVPDRKEATYYRPLDDPAMPLSIANSQRSWATLNDRVSTFGGDLTYPLTASVKLKVGGLTELKNTDYRIRYFNVLPDYFGGISETMTTASLDQVFDQNNFGAGKFLMEESSKASDSYGGRARLDATYAMLDLPFAAAGQRFRFLGGVRYEFSEQVVSIPRTLVAGGLDEETRVTNRDVLPSVNLAWMVNPVMNVRFAYSHSVNRPEFRELASTGFYDFIKNEMVGGNPDLKRSLATNLDVRVEMFPGPGELFAVSYFHKDIADAIEEKLVQTATRTRTWFNSPMAENQGWEFEVRKTLGFVGEFWERFSVTGNYTRIRSTVKINQIVGNSVSTETVASTRPMQGQSPYMVNVSLLYTEQSTGTSINLLYNVYGRRMNAVGFLASDIYEEPREIVDLSASQPIVAGLELKASVKNLNNSRSTLTRDGVLYERSITGRTYSLQLSKTF